MIYNRPTDSNDTSTPIDIWAKYNIDLYDIESSDINRKSCFLLIRILDIIINKINKIFEFFMDKFAGFVTELEMKLIVKKRRKRLGKKRSKRNTNNN